MLDMDDEMLDEYLQFCEKALLPREDRMPGAYLDADLIEQVTEQEYSA